ncbi:hypothetical protein [Runella aurantiaca]|nr:hypothetical protein [Runella aurantiaca]
MKQACGIAAKPARNLVGRGMLAQQAKFVVGVESDTGIMRLNQYLTLAG